MGKEGYRSLTSRSIQFHNIEYLIASAVRGYWRSVASRGDDINDAAGKK